MADNKQHRGARDRATVSGAETYEVDYFATKHNLSRKEAQTLIDRVGNSRTALEEAVANQSKAAGVKKRSTAKKLDQPVRVATNRPKSAATSATRRSAKRSTPSRSATGTRAFDQGSVVAAPRKKSPGANGRATAARKASSGPSKAAAKRSNEATTTEKSGMFGRTAAIVGAAAAGLATGLAANFGRKALVQAPSALAGDWFEALKTEHALALALFDRLQETGSEDSGKRTTLLTQLKHALGKHAFTEENVIYPALRVSGDIEHADGLNHDHGYVKQNLYDLEEMDNDAPGFLAKVASFRAELEKHISEEENLIFPPLHAALGEDGNAKLTAQANKEGFKLA